MAKSQGEEDAIKSVHDAQDSANRQSAHNVITFKRYFGPKLEKLTDAINFASEGSSFLSKVIIVLTVVGTIIAGMQWYSINSQGYKFSTYSNEQLECVINNSKYLNDNATGAVIEKCKRELKLLNKKHNK